MYFVQDEPKSIVNQLQSLEGRYFLFLLHPITRFLPYILKPYITTKTNLENPIGGYNTVSSHILLFEQEHYTQQN